MNSFLTSTSRRAAGFTLIELMVVVLLVAILAAIAYPSYMNQVQATRRAEGKAGLLDTAQRLERCYTRFGRYDDSDCEVSLPLTTAEGNYSIAPVGSIGAASFTLAATPQNAQAGDTKCGVLRLTSSGNQGSQGTDTDANDCW